MAAQRGRRGREKNGCGVRKSNWDRADGPAGGLDPGNGMKGWNEGLGWCLTTRRPGKREMRESPKLAERLENVKIVPSHRISVTVVLRSYSHFFKAKSKTKQKILNYDPGVAISTTYI